MEINFLLTTIFIALGVERGESMNANSDKILLPNDVRKLLNVDNKEIVELCKKHL